MKKAIDLKGVLEALNKTNKKYKSALNKNTGIILIRSMYNEMRLGKNFKTALKNTTAGLSEQDRKVYKHFIGSYFGSKPKRKQAQKQLKLGLEI